MRLSIIAIFTLFSCCTVFTQYSGLYSTVFGTYGWYGPNPSSVNWLLAISIPSGVVQNFTIAGTTYENMTLNYYIDADLNSTLLSINAAPFPDGYTLFQGQTTYNINYSYMRGFYVFFNNPAILTASTLSIPLYGVNGTTYGLLYWSQAFGQYAWLPGTLANNILTVPGILYNGVYSIVSYDYVNFFNQYVLFGQLFTVTQNFYTFNCPYGFALTASAQSPINVTIYYNTSNPSNTKPPSNYTVYNQFVDIQANGAVVGLMATLTFTYTTYEPNFVIGYVDDVHSKWIYPDSGLEIDTTDHGVNQNTTHFSTWGLFGEPSNPNAGAILSPFPLLWLLFVLFFVNIIHKL